MIAFPKHAKFQLKKIDNVLCEIITYDDVEIRLYFDGFQFWYQNGVYHRDDGPAIIYTNGSQCWYRNGVYHRDDGPAIIRADGTQEWYRNGEYIEDSCKAS